MSTKTKKINVDSSANQDIKGQFVAREVKACFSYEMDAILKQTSQGNCIDDGALPVMEDIENLYEYKCPECGEAFNPDDNCKKEEDEQDTKFVCPSCQKEYDSQDDLENEPHEVFEWWIVTEYLYEKLKAKGCPVLAWGINYYWGRCTTGQAISMDGVISNICQEMEILEGQKNSWAK